MCPFIHTNLHQAGGTKYANFSVGENITSELGMFHVGVYFDKECFLLIVNRAVYEANKCIISPVSLGNQPMRPLVFLVFDFDPS